MTALYVDGEEYLDLPEMVLLDKDGTLIDIHHYWTSMIRLRAQRVVDEWLRGRADAEEVMARLIEAMGVNMQNGRLKPEGPVGVKPRPFIVAVATRIVRQVGIKMDDAHMEALFAEIDRQTAANLQTLLRLLPGVEEFLKALTAHGIAAAVVSTDITSRAAAAIEALGMARYFRAIVGGDAVMRTKPAADLAHVALARGGYNASRSVAIGDHPVDIQMGQNAGCARGIAVLTGLSDRAAFAGLGCVVVPDLTHLAVR